MNNSIMPENPAARNPGTLPYPYNPPLEVITGRSFGPVFRALAWMILLSLLAWVWRLGFDWQSTHGAWVGVAWIMLAYIVVHIQRSRIRLDGECIEQTWMWRRRMALRELAFVKIMRVRGLEFLIAPRIYARSLSGTFVFFYCYDQTLLKEFDCLARALKLHEHRPGA